MAKRLKTETRELELEIPRDREGSFDPVLVPKGQRRLHGFDEKVTERPAEGMLHNLRPLVVVMAGTDVVDPYKD